ncbi:hypothetical protein CEXT_699121 [Caerostris extrusa]|uniref:Uncharacterized protein n=1 Tax=Caerostris extrusa TaxID=172846 RepID=A0AAV4V5I1_CAEEX|nr:hypothetical protein CEXT_699121 [Caerostris extrusa]
MKRSTTVRILPENRSNHPQKLTRTSSGESVTEKCCRRDPEECRGFQESGKRGKDSASELDRWSACPGVESGRGL